jgi:hypothetical protein
MSRPLVSVTMVVCNVDRFLAEAIESVLAQTFRDFEFIIVDFGSNDSSKSITSKYAAIDSRIRFQEIPHCGLAEARNAACALAQGKYIAIMDADDVSVPERLSWQVDFMEAHPRVGAVGGAVEWIDAAGRALTVFGNPTQNREIQLALNDRCPLWQPTALMRRDAFVSVGRYRAPFAPAEDYDLWLRIAERFQLANLEPVVLKYRIHPQQVSLQKRTQQTLGMLAAQESALLRRNGLPDSLDAISEITPEVLAALGVSKARVQSEAVSYTSHWIRSMCLAGEHTTALKAAIEALRCNLDHVERWRVADLRLMVARLQWKQGRPLSSGLSALQAVLTRPAMLARPLKPLLRRIGFVGPASNDHGPGESDRNIRRVTECQRARGVVTQDD